MVSMQFKDFLTDPVIPIDDKLFKSLSTVDQQRVKKAHCYSSSSNNASHPLSDDESDEKKQEAKRRAVVGNIR